VNHKIVLARRTHFLGSSGLKILIVTKRATLVLLGKKLYRVDLT